MLGTNFHHQLWMLHPSTHLREIWTIFGKIWALKASFSAHHHSRSRIQDSRLGNQSGLFVPLHFRSRERKVHIWKFCGTFPWYFCSLEHSLPWSEKSKNCHSMELSHPWNFCSSGAFVPRNIRSHTLKMGESITAICP